MVYVNYIPIIWKKKDEREHEILYEGEICIICVSH